MTAPNVESGRLVESERLHARARALVHAFEAGRPMPEPFDVLAVDLARFQARRVPGYARLCAARGVLPDRVRRAADAPAVPTDAFKLAEVFAFDPTAASATFRTSGTSVGARGVHRMRDPRTYDAAALAFGRRMLARGVREASVLVVGPPADEAPDSSLGHMCDVFARALAPGGPRAASDDAPGPVRGSMHFIRDGALDVRALRTAIASLPATLPAIVLATSFALVHLLDAISGHVLALPSGSRVMQTGGIKGRSREVGVAELRSAVARAFAVDERNVVSEYGMTELSSQFWEATIDDSAARHGVFLEPPWARVIPVDPESLAPVAPGKEGIARIEDLANVDSAFAVLAQDRVRRVDGGFELLGRVSGSTPRGCSIAIDEMLLGGEP
jgi:hypothetical protein